MKILVGLIIALLSISPAATEAFKQNKPQNSSSLKTKVKKEELIARLEKFIPQVMKDGEVPGLSIALVRDSQILWHSGFGVKDAGTFSGFKFGNAGPEKIDYVLVQPGTEVMSAEIVRYSRNDRYPSDHFPVTARVRLVEAR